METKQQILRAIEELPEDANAEDSGRGRPTHLVEESNRNIRADLAEGRLNTSPDWHEWTDALIFREEQRAIGEVMITHGGGICVVLGYAQFSLWGNVAGLTRISRELLAEAEAMDSPPGVVPASIDLDATVIESWKREAQPPC